MSVLRSMMKRLSVRNIACRASFRKFAVEQLESRLLMASDIRVAMAGEGYLAYQGAADESFGHERAGWTSITHPGGLGETNHEIGYDYSSTNVSVHATIVKDGSPIAETAKNGGLDFAEILRDFDVANQIFAQAGLTILMEDDQFSGVVQNLGVTFPIDNVAEALDVTGHAPSRTTEAKVVNAFYVTDFPVAPDQVGGLTLMPNDASSGVVKGANDGIIIADNVEGAIFAHELVVCPRRVY